MSLLYVLLIGCYLAGLSYSNHVFPSLVFHEKPLFVIQKNTPQVIMTDIMNQFAFKVLYSHSISNENNFAFSPCGLGSVLIALFEGSGGKSSYEMYRALHLPWERDIVRVGYRDIHRRLKVILLINIFIA